MEFFGGGYDQDGIHWGAGEANYDVCSYCKLFCVSKRHSYGQNLAFSCDPTGGRYFPYLFLLCAKALSSQLSIADDMGELMGVPTSKHGPHVNHLFFADDSLLFCKANLTHWNRLTNILKSYEQALRQQLNLEKIAIFFSSNTLREMQEKILGIAGIPSSQRYDTYLG